MIARSVALGPSGRVGPEFEMKRGSGTISASPAPATPPGAGRRRAPMPGCVRRTRHPWRRSRPVPPTRVRWRGAGPDSTDRRPPRTRERRATQAVRPPTRGRSERRSLPGRPARGRGHQVRRPRRRRLRRAPEPGYRLPSPRASGRLLESRRFGCAGEAPREEIGDCVRAAHLHPSSGLTSRADR